MTLAEYISGLEQAGELVRIRTFVDPVLEMADIADRMVKSPGGGKALLFENTGTAFPVLMNMMGSERRMLRALGVAGYAGITDRIDALFAAALSPKKNLWDKLKLLPALAQASQWFPTVSGKRGTCQEIVMEKPDLSQLPVLQTWAHDGGRFITLPIVHTKDPATGIRNAGMYRMQLFSENTTGMHWHTHKTGAKHYRDFAASARGGVFPVAVALGGDPVYSFCAAAPMPENMDEYLLAGFLRNRKVALVRCLTQPVEVPADADFVIEGYIDPAEAPVVEGPFGDHTGFYSLDDRYPLFHVTCITHRRHAVYPATVVGIPPQEDAYMSQAIEKIFLTPIRAALAPEVRDLHLPFEGVSHNIAIVKIDAAYRGQAVKVAHALWGAGQMMFNKIMIVTDGETDITDYRALWNAIAANYRPQYDTYFSHGPLDILDHAAAAAGFGGKICIDATIKSEVGGGVHATVHDAPPLGAPFAIRFDDGVDTADLRTCAWLLGNNIDAVRDCRVEHGKLMIDARSKSAKDNAPDKTYPARWPNIVCADAPTIAAVDAKWHTLGLGSFIPSPSLKYASLVRPGGAVANG
ncbi:MAG: menaquinone biosynthesis decarboxylase [Prevotellaceae bacterium]|jgi:4-hydroxy-3-polyprenylbenzoate decarboxylase|nr:menaquinone biosynthesis decarboxylase [Prevotellaceae bacterium]